MCTKTSRAGFTLTETMVAVGLASLLMAAIASMTVFSARTFLVTSNYATMNQQSRLGLDLMSQDIRQADQVLSCTENSLTLRSATNTIRFDYDRDSRAVRRIRDQETRVMIRDCDYIRYDMFQRNATNGTYDHYPTANPGNCKVVQVTIACSKPVYGTTRKDSAVQQAAKIVIRKQK